eukprot:CAMPEP_0198144314 /NCGR_PEP_ID=MMETSP1443-20131203/14415_1 /TAXON_ID=186043 /ORGANISM="Entomoneis sp., Strain CCMP2396" /LENGTH=66 /DNA_ID=CAMNT_0043807683 /DNA_START=137 /DNA_END=334 /DNA_ORIENTATION=-
MMDMESQSPHRRRQDGADSGNNVGYENMDVEKVGFTKSGGDGDGLILADGSTEESHTRSVIKGVTW